MSRAIDQNDLDEMIFKKQIILAIKTVAETRACGLHKAIDIISERYDELRSLTPDRFVCGPDEYWKNFHS